MELLLAIQFLTMIPIQIKGKVETIDIARAMACFPLVGFVLGLLTAGVYVMVSKALPPAVCDLLAILFLIMITGNMHMDGLMDTVDGIYSGKSRERVLEIMKDSRVGSHGVTAGVMALLARFVLLGQIPGEEQKLLALIIVPIWGRWAQVYAAAVFPYARAEGGTASFSEKVGKRELFWTTLTAAGLTLMLNGLAGGLYNGLIIHGGILTVILLAGNALLARYIAGKLGGLTGDTYGALNESIELLALLTIVAMK